MAKKKSTNVRSAAETKAAEIQRSVLGIQERALAIMVILEAFKECSTSGIFERLEGGCRRGPLSDTLIQKAYDSVAHLSEFVHRLHDDLGIRTLLAEVDEGDGQWRVPLEKVTGGA